MDTLLITPRFFGYDQELVRALADRGRSAMWHDDRPATDTLTKGLVRLSPRALQRRSDRYFANVFAQAADHDIRDVLIIKGEALSSRMIVRMRAMFPKAHMTLYYWDSYRNMPKGSADKVGLFDRAFSFDLEDTAVDSRLTYRPLFFLEHYAQVAAATQDIDLLFVGTAHSDRMAVVERVARAMPDRSRFHRQLYARSRLLHGVQKLVDTPYRRTAKTDFIFEPIAKSEMQRLVARSRAVLDVERSIQTGFTIRTIEMLGAGRKLVTTNRSILQADFYDPGNQLYIDRENPVIDPGFFEAPWQPQDPALLHRYSVSGWIDDVLG